MLRFFFLSILLTVGAWAGGEKHRVLIIDGFSNHDWKQTTALAKKILSESGLFEIEVTTAPAEPDEKIRSAWRPDFSRYNVVIQNCNNLGNGITWPEEVEKSLESYVSKGGGLLILHSANNSFHEWEEYNRMIGMGWRPKHFGTALVINEQEEIERIPPGSGSDTGHGPRVDALLTRLADHPIHKNYPRKWMAADLELYYYCRGPAENLRVLSYAREPKTGLQFPVEWIIEYGEGNVYNSTFGHVWKNQDSPPGARCMAFQTALIRATEWLATGETTYPLPKNFPTEEQISLSK